MQSIRALHVAADEAKVKYDAATEAFLENHIDRETWRQIRAAREAAALARDAAMVEVTDAWQAYIAGHRDTKQFEDCLIATLECDATDAPDGLLPCPFCGSTDLVNDDEYNEEGMAVSVLCAICNGTDGPSARAAWNSRAVDSLVALRERCIAACYTLEAQPASEAATNQEWAYMEVMRWIRDLLPEATP
jgi:hypothetical protein